MQEDVSVFSRLCLFFSLWSKVNFVKWDLWDGHSLDLFYSLLVKYFKLNENFCEQVTLDWMLEISIQSLICYGS